MVAPKPSSSTRAALTRIWLVVLVLPACSSAVESPASGSGGQSGDASGSGGRSTSGGVTGSGGLGLGGWSAGGAAATAGSAGSAGVPSQPPVLTPNADCGVPPQVTATALIDDLEDGDDVIAPSDGRVGYWFTFHDTATTGMQWPAAVFEPAPGGREGSSYAAHTSGSGFSLWGAGMGLSLYNSSELTCGYDASTCSGVSFWAKSDSSAPDSVRLRVATSETTPHDRGGSCGEPYETWCHNDFGVAITLTGDWRRYAFDWSELQQEGGWGLMTEFNATRVVLLQWQVPVNARFDFWIDDVTFTGCGGEGGMAGAGGAG